MLLLTHQPLVPVCGPKVVAGGDLQEEVVESEGTVLENGLTYKRRRECGCAWPGWKRGRWEMEAQVALQMNVGEGRRAKAWKGARISSHHIKLPLPPPLACGEEEGLRWAPVGPLEPFLLLTRGHVDQLEGDGRNESQMARKGHSSCCGRFCQAECPNFRYLEDNVTKLRGQGL